MRREKSEISRHIWVDSELLSIPLFETVSATLVSKASIKYLSGFRLRFVIIIPAFRSNRDRCNEMIDQWNTLRYHLLINLYGHKSRKTLHLSYLTNMLFYQNQ